MKTTLILFFSSFFLLGSTSWAQKTTIDHPEVGKSSTQMLHLDKIVLTDTATILYIDAYNRPNTWIRIDSGSTLRGASKIYKLQKAVGIELSKEVYMPESGNVYFALLFDPIDKNEKKIDYIEGDIDGAFKLQDISLSTQKPHKKINCLLKGEVKNRPQSSRLLLLKINEDPRVSVSASIPIRNGKFEYNLSCDDPEGYELIFWEEFINGQMRPIPFIAEPKEIKFTLHPINDYKLNVTEGGKLNKEIKEFEHRTNSPFEPLYEKRNTLEENKKYYTPYIYSLYENIRDTKDQLKRDSLINLLEKGRNSEDNLTDEAKALNEQVKRLTNDNEKWQQNYLKENKSLASYYILLKKVVYAKYTDLDIDSLISLYAIYAKMYPKHPYTIQTKQLIDAYLIKPGNKYVDFTAPDLKGNPVTLSEQIKGKIALIDLWASWCGSCRRNSMKMIPIYEQYKDKGFTIVGVARENNSADAMINAIKQDKYPWLNLIELNDKNNIWIKYGAGNSGGRTILVDKDGTILAVDVKAQEVEAILKDKL